MGRAHTIRAYVGVLGIRSKIIIKRLKQTVHSEGIEPPAGRFGQHLLDSNDLSYRRPVNTREILRVGVVLEILLRLCVDAHESAAPA